MRKVLLTIGIAALALAGCVQANNLDPNFGRAVRQNVAAQIADPAPRYAREEPPASDGPRTALAQQRYQKNEVIEPVTTSTSIVGNSSGGGGK